MADGLSADQREAIARDFHEAYERLAPDFGYETRPESAVAWKDVPEANRNLMMAVVGEVVERWLGEARHDALHCDHCGSLAWTVAHYGRITHKQACSDRTTEYHQGDPQVDSREMGWRREWERTARRDEQERIKAGIEALPISTWAGREANVRLTDALGVIEGSEATDG